MKRKPISPEPGTRYSWQPPLVDAVDTALALSSSPREARPKAVDVNMLREALRCLSGEFLVSALYMSLADHPELTAAQLEDLSNRLGRAAHERARYD